MDDNLRLPHAHDEDALDGCGCGRSFREADAVSDAALPPTTGGVDRPHATEADEEQIDGCDVDLAHIEGTPDAALPIATGGVS